MSIDGHGMSMLGSGIAGRSMSGHGIAGSSRSRNVKPMMASATWPAPLTTCREA